VNIINQQKRAFVLASCIGLLSVTSVASADLLGLRPAFGATNQMESYFIDPASGVATALPNPTFNFTGGWSPSMFAVDLSNQKYYVMTDPSGSAPASLYTLDLTDGALIGTQSLSGAAPERIDAMSVLSDGSIVGLDLGSGAFDSYSIDPTTGIATALPTSSFAISGGWGTGMFAIDESANAMYVTTDPSSGPANLYTVNLTTGALQSTQSLGGGAPLRIDAMSVLSDGSILGLDLGAGAIDTYNIDPGTAVATALATSTFAISGGWGDGMFAVDESSGEFYVATDPSGSVPANLYNVDLANGALLNTQALSGAAPVRIDAMAYVPEPGCLMLLAVGAAGLVGRRTRKKRRYCSSLRVV
jgi:hypothetical protein